jgi:putative endonuclease
MAGTSPAMTVGGGSDGRDEPGRVERGWAGTTVTPLASLSLARDGEGRDMLGGWVYMMTNHPDGVLYIGVTSDLARRVSEHREGRAKGFTRRHGLKRLVYTEFFEDIRDAIQREKNMKHYSRAWKVGLILETNRYWCDLYETLNQ